jgi:hypothetical protein
MPDLVPTNSITSRVLGSLQLAGAEISAFDAASQRVFTTSNFGLQIIDLSDPADPQLIDTIQFAFSNDVTSVAVYNGLVAVTVTSPNRIDPGKLFLLDSDGNVLREFTVGSVPDMVTFSPDGTKLLVANEGEATFASAIPPGGTAVNPVGSISVIDLSGGVAAATVQTAGFEAFNGAAAALIAEGVRLFVNSPGFAGITVAQDLEPEYIAIAPDGLSAMITLQEANAVAILDLSGATPTITDIVPLGLKSWLGLEFDGSDRDGPGNSQKVNFQTDLNLFGMYMPDAIASYSVGGQTYYVLANEGDDRNDFLTETTTVGSGSYVIDTDDYPDAAALKTNAEIGRLTLPRLAGVNGDTDGDGKVDQILTYGGRSFSIRDSQGNLVFDSGAEIDLFVAQYFPDLFDDGRSDNKGSEPEGATIATFDGRTYAFITLERFNSTIVYDITDPASPKIATFLANAGDVAPEQGIFISAADSPSGEALFLVSNETSGTLTVYELMTPNTVGGNGNDELIGTISADLMTGGNGNDFIYANAGDDQLFGGNGDDQLDGGRGDDLLAGGRGSDTLTTGIGEDVIFVSRGDGEDVVTDFDTDLDSIRLEGGVQLNSSRVIDFDSDGTDDLLLSFKYGGGTLVLLGVSDGGLVDFVAG